MPVTVSDTFTRANTTNGTLGSTETGLTLAWQNATNWRINSNTATNDTTSLSPSWILVSQPSITASITTGSTNGPGVAFWVKDSSNYWFAYMYSNRYVWDTPCNSCQITEANCACGGCTPIYSYSRTLSTGTGSTRSGCNATCAVSTCTTSTAPACNSANVGSGTYDTYVSACGSVCNGKSVDSQVCATTNTCGKITTVNSCATTACTTSTSIKKCGTASCAEIGTTCTGTCAHSSQTNRNCNYTCNQTQNGTNAANSCAVTYNTCPPCATSTVYHREYYLRVGRVSSGSVTYPYDSLYTDTTSSTISFAAIKVITTNGSFQAIGYSDAAMTTIAKDSGVVASGVTDYLNTVGCGMIRMDLGSASPNLGYAVDNFSVTYEPLGGDSVGIIQG